MDKKTIVKVALTIVVIIVIIFLINFGRKTYIISKFNEKYKEYSQITNFYYKRINTQGQVEEYWRKENNSLLKLTDSYAERMRYKTEDGKWILTKPKNDNESKVAIKIDEPMDTESTISSSFDLSKFYVEGIVQAINMAFNSKISTEKINNIECYKILIGSSDDVSYVYVNKTDFVPIKMVDSNGNDYGTIEKYEFNNVNDEDVKIPSLDEYTIKESQD